jgi:hypothetical protein
LNIGLPLGGKITGEMIAKVIEKPSAIFNAETLFKQFAANGQSLTFDEFSNIFKKLKL